MVIEGCALGCSGDGGVCLGYSGDGWMCPKV